MRQVKKSEFVKVPEQPVNNVLDFGNTLRELRKNVDPDLVRQREGWRDRNGNVQMVDYVEWHTVADILDEKAPNWGHSIRDIRQIGEIMTVTVAITIDGVTREGIGTGSALSDTGVKKAEHDALKRAAVKFGIARELYKREFDESDRDDTEAENESDKFPLEPIAANLSDLITAKQLGMIRAIGREIDLDTEEECRQILNCGTGELSRRAASSFIDHLLKIQKRHGASAPPLRRAG